MDLVLIATTADSHRALVEQAAAAGALAILCEKPMATSVADCDAMIAACQRAGCLLAVNHQMRFMEQYTRIKGELDSGRFGPLASMNVVAGCFGMSMNGSHYCEAFRWLTGSDIVSATAWFAPEALQNPRGPQFADQAGEVRFESADGRRLYLSIGADQGHGGSQFTQRDCVDPDGTRQAPAVSAKAFGQMLAVKRVLASPFPQVDQHDRQTKVPKHRPEPQEKPKPHANPANARSSSASGTSAPCAPCDRWPARRAICA